MIYADNSATTKLDTEAFEAMIPWLKDNYANASQPYSFARASKKALLDARATIAECIHSEPDEIYFTSGGSESDNWAIKGSAFSDAMHRATITSQIEHHAVLHSCAAIERLGYPVIYLPVDKNGIVLPETLERNITNQTRIVSIMTANNELGSIQPINELSEIAHRSGAIFHSDAVQAVGHIPINVQELGVDMLSASAHKFNGPKGIGFLYIRHGTVITPFIDGGAQELKMRAGTENIASIVGMSVALKKNIANQIQNINHITNLEKLLLSELTRLKIPFVRNGINTLPGILNLSFPGYNGEMILHRMDLKGICVSTGSACNGNNNDVSYVLRSIGLPEETALGTIRISLGHYNTKEEVLKISQVIKEIVT